MQGQGTLEQLDQPTHKQGNNEPCQTTETSWSLQSFHQDVWGEKSSLGQKLCKAYLNTYHYTTGSRRTRGSRVGEKKKKKGKTQSILMIESGGSVASNLGT